MHNKSLRRALLGCGLLAAAAGAQAQSAGSWLVKAGVNHIAPDVSSGNLSPPSLPDTKIDVKAATSVIATAAYMLSDNWSVEGYAGLGYKHDIVGDGSIAGVGKLGTVKQISPTLFGQYRFMAPSAAVRPYVGLGVTYAYFYDEQGSGVLTALTAPGSATATRQSVDAAWGTSAQLGVSVALKERWFLDASVIKTFVKTTTQLSTGQTIETKLDPVAVNVSIGYRF